MNTITKNKHYKVLLSFTSNHVAKVDSERLGGMHAYVNDMGQKIWSDQRYLNPGESYYEYASGGCSYTEKIAKKLIEARKITFTKEVA